MHVNMHIRDSAPEMEVRVFKHFQTVEVTNGKDSISFYLNGIDASENFVETLRTAYAKRRVIQYGHPNLG